MSDDITEESPLEKMSYISGSFIMIIKISELQSLHEL